MVDAILIREAAPEEFHKIEDLVKAAYREFRPLFPADIWQAWMDNIRKVIHADAGLLLVLEDQGQMQGVVKFFPQAAQSGMGHWPEGVAAIRVLAVRPEARGRGYGTRLTRACLERARDLRVSVIYLFTGEFMHAARHIYEKLGFQRAPEFDPHPGPIAYRLELTG